MQDRKHKERRRRTCGDRARRWALEQQKKRRPNPAAKVVSQLFLLLSALVWSMPMPTPVLSSSPVPRPLPCRKPKKKPVPITATRLVYERYDGGGWPFRYRGKVPTFQTLLVHIQGVAEVRREDAIHVLRRVVEPDVIYWLEDVIRRKAWGDLATTIRPGASADTVHTAMLKAAIAWTRETRGRSKKGDKGTDKKTKTAPKPGDGGPK